DHPDVAEGAGGRLPRRVDPGAAAPPRRRAAPARTLPPAVARRAARRLARSPPPSPAAPSVDAVSAAAHALSHATRPVILIGRVSTDHEDWRRRVELAERLHARVVTDWKTGASFPTRHALHPHPPAMFIGTEAAAMLRDAD